MSSIIQQRLQMAGTEHPCVQSLINPSNYMISWNLGKSTDQSLIELGEFPWNRHPRVVVVAEWYPLVKNRRGLHYAWLIPVLETAKRLEPLEPRLEIVILTSYWAQVLEQSSWMEGIQDLKAQFERIARTFDPALKIQVSLYDPTPNTRSGMLLFSLETLERMIDRADVHMFVSGSKAVREEFHELLRVVPEGRNLFPKSETPMIQYAAHILNALGIYQGQFDTICVFPRDFAPLVEYIRQAQKSVSNNRFAPTACLFSKLQSPQGDMSNETKTLIKGWLTAHQIK